MKIKLLTGILALSLITATAFAQAPSFSMLKNTDKAYPSASQRIIEGDRAQNVFVEAFGQGLLITANYDTRFAKRRDGLGGRVGIGYIASDGDRAMTIPLSLNYLMGKGNKFFEIGLGATILSTSGDNDSFFFDGNESNVVGTMSFSYRVQPADTGFSFRAGLTPIFNGDFFVPYYGGLSLGYTFK